MEILIPRMFPNPTNSPFLPLSGVYLYYSNAETIELKIVTSHYHMLTVQGVELSPCFTKTNNKHYGASGRLRPE